MFEKGVIFAIVFLAAASASAQDRAASPYFACGADVALEKYKSSDPIASIQQYAATKCATFLEQNVQNSYAAMEKENGPIGAEYRSYTQERLRKKLVESLPLLVENNVAALRAGLR